MRTEVIVEDAAFELWGSNAWSNEASHVVVTWEELRSASVGTRWTARDVSSSVRGSRNEEAVVVYKDHDGAAVLHCRWGTTDDQNPQEYLRVWLVWYEFARGA